MMMMMMMMMVVVMMMPKIGRRMPLILQMIMTVERMFTVVATALAAQLALQTGHYL